MEIESAARRYLLGKPDVAGYVQQRVYKFRLDEPIEETGTCAIVLQRLPGWASPDQIQSSEFPRLAVDCWADPTRVAGTGEIERLDAEDKAFAVARVVRPWFCYPYLLGQWMGAVGSNPGLFVIASSCYAEPRILDPHIRQQGDTVGVRIEFALMTVH